MKALAIRAQALREMVRLLKRRPGSFVLAVLLSAAALTMPLAGASIARALAPLVDPLVLGPEVNLFVAPAAAANDIRRLQTMLATRPDVARVEWISRDAALKSLLQRAGGALGELKSNPLPDVLVVTFAPGTTAAAVDAAAAELRNLPRIDSVGADTGWHRRLDALLQTGSTAILSMAALSAALLVLIVLGAVQLQLASSRDNVRVLRMVGADTSFIVRPFAYAGAATLGFGATLAALLSLGGIALLGPPIAELTALYGLSVSVRPLPVGWLAASIAAATAVGGVAATLGARLAIRSFR